MLFWPTVRKKCSSDQDFFLKFEAEGREFAKILRSLKVSFFQKDFLVSLDSPKKRTNEFVFSTQTAFRDAKPR